VKSKPFRLPEPSPVRFDVLCPCVVEGADAVPVGGGRSRRTAADGARGSDNSAPPHDMKVAEVVPQ
jgi:hypothetical protein